jgi:hypothetical protein
MYCPNCGSEYREGFTRCVDCDCDLVAVDPARAAEPRPRPVDVVTVYATGDPVAFMTAKALLEEAGIPFLARNEALQDLFALGRLGTGFNLVAGPMEIQVAADRREEAEDLLRAASLESGLEELAGEEGEGEPGEDPSRW